MDDTKVQSKEPFYHKLSEVHKEVILAGDLNDKVGSKQKDEVIVQDGKSLLVRGINSHQMLIEHCNQKEVKLLK